MNPTIGVIVFPGSNCEQDALEAVTSLGADSKLLWHDSSDLGDVDGVIIPGGFAHGDYLRPGAMHDFHLLWNLSLLSPVPVDLY